MAEKIRVTVELDPSQLKAGAGEVQGAVKGMQKPTQALSKDFMALASTMGIAFGAHTVRQIGTAALEMAKLSA